MKISDQSTLQSFCFYVKETNIITMEVFEHEHSLDLADSQLNYPHDEEEYDDEDNDLTIEQDFRRACDRCDKEINWFHRYYYKCSGSCDFFLHKFCAELPATLKHISHDAHTLILTKRELWWHCDVCKSSHDPQNISYLCSTCDFDVDVNCATAMVEKRFYHPSHPHPLVLSSKLILCMCDACGKEHKGNFYQCIICPDFFIHSDCAFLPKKLVIQQITKDVFYHTHPLTLSYSLPKKYQHVRFTPTCRICDDLFHDHNIWIYKCEKCRYYVHLDCATSRGEPFMSILVTARMGKTLKNFEDIDHPNLLHLPFPDQTYSIQKHLFFQKTRSRCFETDDKNLKHVSHQHPLILVHTQSNDATRPTSSRTTSLACHNPMKKIELLCNGCVQPIMTMPFYKCNNEVNSCNFVLHEWCTQLPIELQNHPGHPQHALVLQPNVPHKFFGVFRCNVCLLPCNGFVYSCVKCDYHIDVNCGFLPEKITHEAHPNHLLWRVKARSNTDYCVACVMFLVKNEIVFSCGTCNFDLHPECALLLPQTISHKYDKHPMELSYFPIENHKSEYFCEICEDELSPYPWFYHCKECVQSIHSACAPVILDCERAAYSYYSRNVYQFVNIKFGGILKIEGHPHPVSFVQGIESDGECKECASRLQHKMIFKCLQCNYALDFECCQLISNVVSV